MDTAYGSDYYSLAPISEMHWMDGCAAGFARGIKGEEDISGSYIDSDNENERMFGRGMAHGYPEGAMKAQHISNFGIPFDE